MACLKRYVLFLILTFNAAASGNRVKRSPFFFGQSGCTSLVVCLGSANRLLPYRLNLRIVDVYDRVKSHLDGDKGWVPDEVRLFEATRAALHRLKVTFYSENQELGWIIERQVRELARRQKHEAKLELWRQRIQLTKELDEVFLKTNLTMQESTAADLTT